METQAMILNGILWYLAFLFSTVCHESAHAYASNRFGDSTARQFISLNPLPHIQRSPFGMVVIPVLIFLLSNGNYTFGYASVPINTYWASANPKPYAIVSLMGPLANLVIATFSVFALAGILAATGLGFDEISQMPLQSLPVAGVRVLEVLFLLNVILAAFNLMPVPPLDGSEIPLLFLSRPAQRTYQQFLWNPSFALPGLLVAYFLFQVVFRVAVMPCLQVVFDLLRAINHG